MCGKCKEVDEKIARVTRLSQSNLDQLTRERFAALIEEYEAQKRAFHPEE